MSEFYQPGQHPDADQLSAFAEDALPAHEREQTLAHLASCVDCRTIVSLALPPIEDVPQLQPAPVRRPWFYGWNVAWLAGAGLAALIFLTVHIHNGGHDEKLAGGAPTQTAAVHPETAPPPPAVMEPTPTDPTRTPAVKAVPPPPPPPTTDSGQALQSSAVGTTFNGQEITNLPAQGRRFLSQTQQQQPSQQQQSQQQNGAVRGYTFGAGTGGVARNNLSPYSQNNAASYNGQNTTVANAAVPAPAAPPPPVLSPQAPPVPAVAAKSTSQTEYEMSVNAATMDMATTNAAPPMTLAPGVAGVQKLPSHLAIASTITHGDQMLALDTAGTLFVSTNGGRHWKTVSAPWPGRAVRVTLASLPVPAKQPSNPLLGGIASRAALSGSDLKQSPGASISGIITDPTGAIIPGVSLKITDTRTGVVHTATSDRSGHYAVAGLAPDAYQIDASSPAFEEQRRFVTLTAAQQSVVNMSLRIGAASETIEVNSESSIVDKKAERRTQKMAKDVSLSEPSAVFEITTDSGEIWTSADGKSWKRK